MIITLIMLAVLVLHSSPISIGLNHRIPFTGRSENSVDPDQLASWKPADMDLHCVQKGISVVQISSVPA